MSDHHLSDEALSALLDDAAPPDAPEHVAACPACADRLAALRAVVDAVAAPVPEPPVEWVDQAVAAAVSTADEARTPTPVTRLPTRHRPTTWLAPVAAVLLLIVGVVAVVGRDTATDPGDDVAMDAADLEAGAGTRADDAGTVDVGDLGAVDDPEVLRGLLAPALDPSPRVAALDDGAGTEALQADDGAPPEPASGPAGATGGSRERRAAGDAPVGQCLPAVRADDPGLGELLVAATATWRGTESVVYGFATGDEHLTRRVYVLGAADCAVLEVLSFSD